MSTWSEALEMRLAVIDKLKAKRVELSANPVREHNIGGLNEKLSVVRQHMDDVRDVLFDVQSLMIKLRRESHVTSDLYESALATEIRAASSWTESAKKALPKSQDEREIYFRQGCINIYKDKLEAERRVEEWEQFQKMVETIYWSLRDTNHDIQTQIAVIKQQYFSGEVEIDKNAKDLFGFLSDDVKSFMKEHEEEATNAIEVPL